jgi:hypothetical protein
VGETHLTWKQFYGSIPVFAGTIKTHFDKSGRLKAVTGTGIPGIAVDPTPTWSTASAAQVARASVASERGHADALRIGTVTLYVYRQGLAQGVPGESHLAWEVEVTDGAGIRDFVYVDAHSGKVIDRINAVHDDLFRRAYDGHNLPFVPPNYPNGPYWVEGQPFPTASGASHPPDPWRSRRSGARADPRFRCPGRTRERTRRTGSVSHRPWSHGRGPARALPGAIG